MSAWRVGTPDREGRDGDELLFPGASLLSPCVPRQARCDRRSIIGQDRYASGHVCPVTLLSTTGEQGLTLGKAVVVDASFSADSRELGSRHPGPERRTSSPENPAVACLRRSSRSTLRRPGTVRVARHRQQIVRVTSPTLGGNITMAFPSDFDIASNAALKPIGDIAADMGLPSHSDRKSVV